MAKTWWWCSFCDLSKPEGQRLIGVAIMSNPEERPKWAAMVEGVDSGATVESLCYQVDPKYGDPPEEWVEKLITDKARIEQLELAWIGAGCVTIAEWEARQMS